MPKFKVSVPHQSERTVVITKLKVFMHAAKKNSPVELTDIEESWDDNGNLNFAFCAMGFRIVGQMLTEGQLVQIIGDLPFAALPFRGALESQLESHIREAMETP